MADGVYNHVRVARQHKLTGVQRILAERLGRAQHEAANVTAMAEANAGALLAARERLRDGTPRVTLTHQLIKAVALCLERHPRLNGALDEGIVYEFAEVNIALAVSSAAGDLQVIVVRDANTKGLRQIAIEVDALLARAGNGKLTLDDVRGGTFTLSNYGRLRHTVWATPILSPGQSGVLGVGRVRERVVAGPGGGYAAQPVLPLALTYDHRVINGVPAGIFLDDLVDIIEGGLNEV